MDDKGSDIEPLDVEAFADGNLQEKDAADLDEKIRRNEPALKKMFGVARLNAALRKARKKLYGDQSLSREIKQFKK